MKAKKIAALCLASVLLLSGCGGKTVDGKSVVASTSEGHVYADDVYDTLISTSSGKSAAFQYVLDQLINKEAYLFFTVCRISQTLCKDTL